MSEDDYDVCKQLRARFELFFVQAFDHTHSGRELSLAPYQRYICDRYQNLKKGDRLVLNQPPRTLKTWTAKFFVAWYLGQTPGAEVMIITNSQRLSETFLYDVRKLMRAKWYRQVFPDARISNDRSGVSHLKTLRGGGIFAGSVAGSLAGFGADLMIVDDGNMIEDASRPEQLRWANDKFDGELYSRLNNTKKGIVINIQHRIHENDLSGHLLQDPDFEHVALPLIAPPQKKRSSSQMAKFGSETKAMSWRRTPTVRKILSDFEK